MLHDFITAHRDQIISRCRQRVATRPQHAHTEAEINCGVPLFLDQLVHLLQEKEDSGADEQANLDGLFAAQIGTSAALHGHSLLAKGFTVSQVVHDYGDICQTITGMALELDAPIATDDFRVLNRCLDDAIAGAVTAYGHDSEQSSLDGQAERGNQRMGFFTHELRNLVNTAIVAFAVLKTGNVGVTGSTGAVLDRSLTNLRDLIARSLAEVRLTAGIQQREPLSVKDFVDGLTESARLEAKACGQTLVITPVEARLVVDADQKVLSAVVANLLQNAFKFSRPNTTVTLVVGASADRVLIEVHDECGGLPGGGELKDLFRPFEQRGADRTGIGIGLAFCRWGAEANLGRLYARDLPGTGCVFTVDLPRSPDAPAAIH